MGKLETGEMKIGASRINRRINPSANAPSLSEAPFNEEFFIVDTATNEEVVRCQQFLQADKKTPAASKKPDPKEINWKGHNYHQTGKRNPDCEHCKAGISTYPTIKDVPQ